MVARLRRFEISPLAFRRVTYVAFGALVAIVLTGAAVRLTGSGLGCPDWPRCYGKVAPPLQVHALVEFSNRIFSGLVGVTAIGAALLGFFRKPFRRELAALGILLPIGVVAQAVLGGLTVESGLKPGYVMAHYVLSMMILDASFALAWCATYEPGERRRSTDRVGTWAVRALLPLGSATILVGTAATASGPHAGASGTGEIVKRLDFRGADTLSWVVQRHGALAVLLGISVVAVVALLHRRAGDRRAVRPLVAVLGLMAAQGVVGIVQYNAKLPTELVWVHVSLAVATWVALLWSVGRAGRIAPAGEPALAPPAREAPPPLVGARS
ncbi:MAG: COX15/CtaA family protein [Solirubrobacteraceae bacterium]